ncbi:hypothetical protein NL676_014900 [Syzygium grande]|nr:hypothetical protein NL676_014900 [Syzygium grande]
MARSPVISPITTNPAPRDSAIPVPCPFSHRSPVAEANCLVRDAQTQSLACRTIRRNQPRRSAVHHPRPACPPVQSSPPPTMRRHGC